MARSIATIKQQIVEAKKADSDLDTALQSTSQTAIWNLWAYITAVAINLHEQALDILKGEIEDLASRVAPGTPQWLRQKVLEFQKESVLGVDENFVARYPEIPAETLAERQIIKRCSIKQESDRSVIVKVAKEVDGVLQPLGYVDEETEFDPDDNFELDALKDYVDDIKFAGTSVRVVSRFGDKIQIYGTVYFDGQYIGDNVQTNVIAAVKQYLSEIPFDGVLYKTKLVDAIQRVPGVADVVLSEVKAKPGNNLDQYTTVTRTYLTSAGYILLDEDDEEYDVTNALEMERAV